MLRKYRLYLRMFACYCNKYRPGAVTVAWAVCSSNAFPYMSISNQRTLQLTSSAGGNFHPNTKSCSSLSMGSKHISKMAVKKPILIRD